MQGSAGFPIGVTRLASGGTSLWAVRYLDHAGTDVVEVDARSDLIEGDPIPLGGFGAGVAVGAGSVWVGTTDDEGGDPGEGPGTVVRIDPGSHAITARIAVGRAPRSIAVGEGSVWVANQRDGTISRIDPSLNQVGATIPVGPRPDLVLTGAGYVWVGTVDDGGSLRRIDPATNRVTAELSLELEAVSPTAVWAIGPGGPNGLLQRVNPSTSQPEGPRLGIDFLPASVAIAGGDVWVGKSFYYCELHNPIPEGPPIISFAWFRVDPLSLHPLSGPVFVGHTSGAPVFAADALWDAPLFGTEVIRLDLPTASRVSPTPSPGLPTPVDREG